MDLIELMGSVDNHLQKLGHYADGKNQREAMALVSDMKEALSNLEVAANTVSYCYTNRPGSFASALMAMEEAAQYARLVLDQIGRN